jgi:hypothetical protein
LPLEAAQSRFNVFIFAENHLRHANA